MEVRDSLICPDGSIVHRCTVRSKEYPADGNDLRAFIRRHEFFQQLDKHLKDATRRPDLKAVVPGNAYVVNTGGSAIALTGASAKTIFYINSGSANQPSFVELSVGFDGVTSTAVPALVELMYGTAATNSTPGTGSTTFTPVQIRAWPAQTSVQTAANACSSEPTVLTSLKPWLVSPYGGLLIIQFPLGREPTGIVTAATSGKQVAVRCTAPANVNVRGYIEYEE